MRLVEIKSNQAGKANVYHIVHAASGFVLYRDVDDNLYVRSTGNFHSKATRYNGVHSAAFMKHPQKIINTYGFYYEALVKTVNGWVPGMVSYNERTRTWAVDTFGAGGLA